MPESTFLGRCFFLCRKNKNQHQSAGLPQRPFSAIENGDSQNLDLWCVTTWKSAAHTAVCRSFMAGKSKSNRSTEAKTSLQKRTAETIGEKRRKGRANPKDEVKKKQKRIKRKKKQGE
ncbi:MAG: hypothetical protein V8R89_01090 [Alphaproteobacteria bacterium]